MQTLHFFADPSENARTFLGEDFHGWLIAMIAAVAVAIIYDVAMSAARKVTLRIPFLVLQLGRLTMSKADWAVQYNEWKSELWSVLNDEDRSWAARSASGMRWAVSVFLQARRAAKADKRARPTAGTSAPASRARPHTVSTPQRPQAFASVSEEVWRSLALRTEMVDIGVDHQQPDVLYRNPDGTLEIVLVKSHDPHIG